MQKTYFLLLSLRWLGNLVKPKFNVFAIHKKNDDLTFSANSVHQTHSLEWNGVCRIAFLERFNEGLMALGQGGVGCQSLEFFPEGPGFFVPGFWGIAHAAFKLLHEVSHLLHGLIDLVVCLKLE